MKRTYFLYLVWLLPVYFLLQGGYQVGVYYGLQQTFNHGSTYMAEVTDFDVKQIAAQTNGYVELRFETSDGTVIEERLSLPVQMAQVIMASELIPIRYKADSFRPISMIPVYDLQRNVVLVNMGVSAIGFLATLVVSLWAGRYVRRRMLEGEEIVDIERIDQDDT